MEIFTGIILYLCYWWLAFMVALPFGIQVSETREGVGFAESAPINPNIGKKFLIATLAAAVLWGITFAMIHYKVLSIGSYN